ncbi:MAG: DUF4476 domain-containing protein [Chlorobi bacterium]|nr:DUF4476 domain-containing protein [Chlorobiota bacterium]
MKRLIFTFAILGVLLAPKSSEAQRYGSSELRLRLDNNSMFTVIFDRRIYNVPTSLFTLSGLRGGSHRLIVKQRVGGRYGAFRTIYNGNINIPARSRVKAKINRYNRLVILNIVHLNNGYGNGYYNNGGGYYNRPMLDIARLQNSMRRASFESDKRIIAEQAVSSHRVKANQVYRILTMFSFESTKLKFAKFAYKYCVDKRNYYLVNNAFSFSSSIRELNNFIGSNQSDYYDNDWNYYNRNNNNNRSYRDNW